MSDASSGKAMNAQVALAIGAAIGAAATLWVAYYAFKPLPRSTEVGPPAEQAREGQLDRESETNGTSLPDESQGFRWTQNHGEVQVLLQLPAAAKARNVDVVFQRGSLSISCMQQKLLDSELSAAIVTGDCGWQIEGSGGSRRLVVTLAKDLRDPKALLWKSLRKGDKEGFGFMHQREFDKLM